MKIAFPIIKAASGSDIYFTLLSNALQNKGLNVELLWLDYSYEFIPFKHRKLYSKLNQFDIIHSNADYGFLFKPFRKPLVITMHHNVFDPCYRPFTNPSQSFYHYGLLRHRITRSLKQADAVVCVSRSTHLSLEQSFTIKKEATVTIHNGIDLQRFHRTTANKPTKGKLIFVGNLSRRKGADLLKPIMEKLGEQYTLTCISFSPSSTIYGPNIKLLNNITVDDLVHYYNASTMLLFPSRLEGFGYVVAEAMACELPVVCSNTSSLPELIDNDLGGYLCTPDNIDEFVTKIRKINGSPELAQKMGKYNREKCEREFDIEKVAEKYIAVYEKILTKNFIEN